MVDLKNIIKNAESANKEFHDGYPPVENWNPEHCGEIFSAGKEQAAENAEATKMVV